MFMTKRPLIALFASSISLIGLVNCSDDATTPGDDAGSSGKAGGSTAGSAGKSGGSVAGETGDAGEASGGKSGSGTSGTTGDAGEAGAPAPGGSGGSGGGTAGGGGDAGDAGSGPVIPNLGPVLRYAFDEATGLVANDSSGHGLNGALAVSAWAADGRNGAGLALSGGAPPDKYVTVPAGVFTDVKETTIGAWVKLGVDTPWSRIFDFGGAGTNENTRFMYLTPNTPAGMRLSVFGGTAEREATVTTGTSLPTNVWKHVAVTAAIGGKHAIYIDGFPAAEATTVDVPPSELEPLSANSWLGKSRFPDPGLNGTLDDFVVYDRVLSPTEIGVLANPKADYSRLPFDEAAGTASNDVSSRAVNATLTGATWASGRLGAAVSLSGTDQYVTLTNPIAGCTTELTIALWVKQAALKNWARIFDFGGTTDNFMYLTAANTENKLRLSIHKGILETTVISNTTVPADSTWHHVAVTVNPLVATVYVDGNATANAALPVTPLGLGATNEHWLGKSRFNTDPYFSGAFDELRISCRAYTADEIKSLAFK